jgi:hypothetical protein
MRRLAFGVVLAAVALYLFGFLWWGLGLYPTLIWEQAVNEDRAAAILKEQFPRNGTYYVPAATGDQDDMARRFESGPVAFVHMLAVDGRPMMDPGIMAMGFLNNLVVIVLIGALLRIVEPAIHSYWRGVQIVTLVGLTAVFLIDFGTSVWWEISWSWQCYQALYDLLFFVIAGLILTPFVRWQPAVDSATSGMTAPESDTGGSAEPIGDPENDSP